MEECEFISTMETISVDSSILDISLTILLWTALKVKL